MTAWGSVEVAVEAMRRGARDFVQKPWDNARLLAIAAHADRAAARAAARASGSKPENRLLRGDGCPTWSPSRRRCSRCCELMERVGAVGRQRADHRRARHRQGGGGAGAARGLAARARASLVTVNAGGLSEGVFESELFGHVKGAFTDAKRRSRRPLRAGRRRHAVPRRDRQHAAQPAGQAAARAARPASSSGGLVAHPRGSTCA